MDERLKKIIEDGDEIRRKHAKSQSDLEESKRKKQAAIDKRYKSQAKLWAAKNFFDLVKKADHDGPGSLYFSDYQSHLINNEDNIPVKFLIDEIKKIDGIRVESTYHQFKLNYDGPSYDAHYSYTVKWRPDPPNRSRDY